MSNYYVRETPDGADVLNRISVTFSALVCTCYEVSTAQQIVNALNAQAPPAAVPAGYVPVPVPVEPTEAMLNAARDWSLKKYGQAVGNDGARGCYAAMIATALAERKGE